MSSSTLINPCENTPLIPKSQSQVVISDQRRYEEHDDDESVDESVDGKRGREVEVYKPGKSSFTQTVRLFHHDKGRERQCADE